MSALADDLLVGADAAAAYCGLPVRTIYHMVAEGKLPVRKHGRRLYFRKSALDAAFRSTGTIAMEAAPAAEPSCGYTKESIETALFRALEITTSHSKVTARFHNLLRLGFPKTAARRGAGARITFSDDAALQAIVGIVLNLAGIDPEDCIRLVEDNEAAINARPADGLTLALDCAFTAIPLVSIHLDGKVFEVLA